MFLSVAIAYTVGTSELSCAPPEQAAAVVGQSNIYQNSNSLRYIIIVYLGRIRRFDSNGVLLENM
jgi:hypothetical protein